MDRRPSIQDITWLVDLSNNNQLDLDPPYQRRSVWSPKEKKFFLDTIFRNFPSPAIFLHKTIDDNGKATYHIVDGKQRTQTILAFINDKIRIDREFGDNRLDGKLWKDIRGEKELRDRFWNYQLTVELINFDDTKIVNDVFDRLNRNSRKLTRQELRHAKYDGWLISEVENESKFPEWKTYKIVSIAKEKRMADIQFISELFLVMLENKISGFDQDYIDEIYADYDDISEKESFDEEDFRVKFSDSKEYIRKIEDNNSAISKYATNFTNFYTLWAVIVLATELPEISLFAYRYNLFMETVELLKLPEENCEKLADINDVIKNNAYQYLLGSKGANTDLKQREQRFNALSAVVFESVLEA